MQFDGGISSVYLVSLYLMIIVHRVDRMFAVLIGRVMIGIEQSLSTDNRIGNAYTCLQQLINCFRERKAFITIYLRCNAPLSVDL